MSFNQVNSSGELERVAGLVNSEKINEMYEAFPSDASASNKLVAQYTPRSEYSINNSSSNDTWYKVGRYTGGNRSSRLDLISDRVDGQTFESSIRISGAGTNANYVSWIGEDGCENSVNAVQIDSSYNLYIKLMSYSAVRIIAYGNFESFDYEALQSSPSGSNIPLQKLVTESDLTSSVTSGSTAPITAGGIYSTFQGQYATMNTSIPNYQSGFCKYVSIGAFIVGSGRIHVSEDTQSAEIVSGLPSNSAIIPVLIYSSTYDADLGYARYEAGSIVVNSLKAGHSRFSFCGLLIGE